MANRPSSRTRYTANLANVGAAGYTTANVTVPLGGKVIEMTAGKTGGTGAQVTVQLKENGARLMLDTGALANFPLQRYELARAYALAPEQQIQVGAKVDAGADTGVSVDLVVEV